MDGLQKTIDLTGLIGRKIGTVQISKWFLQYFFEDEEKAGKPRIHIGTASTVILFDSKGQHTISDSYTEYGDLLCLPIQER
jgi:hypothetical protein